MVAHSSVTVSSVGSTATIVGLMVSVGAAGKMKEMGRVVLVKDFMKPSITYPLRSQFFSLKYRDSMTSIAADYFV